MVRIRLKRLGRKKRPFFRIVVTDIRNRRQGAPLAEIGYYNPMSRELKVDKQAADSWVGKGAIPTETVERLLKQAPESGELIVLERVRKERQSKKAVDRQKAALDAQEKAQAEAAEKAKADAQAAAEAAASTAADESESPSESDAAATAAES